MTDYICAKCGKRVPESHAHVAALPHETGGRTPDHRLFARPWPEIIMEEPSDDE